jgi:hypothetical protein
MMKVILAVAATAVVAFPAGMWAQASMSRSRSIEISATSSTISPSEMQRAVKPDDLPAQYMKGDFN